MKRIDQHTITEFLESLEGEQWVATSARELIAGKPLRSELGIALASPCELEEAIGERLSYSGNNTDTCVERVLMAIAAGNSTHTLQELVTQCLGKPLQEIAEDLVARQAAAYLRSRIEAAEESMAEAAL